MAVRIQCSHFVIRELCKEDAPVLAHYANNRKIWNNVRDEFPHPYHLKDAEQYISSVLEDKTLSKFAIANEKELIGAIGIHPKQQANYRFTVEIGYWLGEAHWGKGIASEAVRAIVQYAIQELSCQKIYAEVYEHNQASMRVLEKAGFEKEAILKREIIKNGKFIDVHRYAIWSKPS